MKFYMQTDSQGVITDMITFPYSNYQEIEAELPLPIGLIGGWYRWENGQFVFDQELFDKLNRTLDT